MTTVVSTASSDAANTQVASVASATAKVLTNRIRPIENRSRTWYNSANNPVRTRAFYPAWGAVPSAANPELSFASVGDLCRLLIIGPGFGYQAGNPSHYNATGTLGSISSSDSKAGGGIYTVTEQLGATLPGAVPDEQDFHIDIAKISTKTSAGSVAGTSIPYDWRRLLDVFDVNSPWYDGLDNSGRGRVVDNAVPSSITNPSPADYVGELYEHGRINLLTAPSPVIQALVAPLQGYVSNTNPSLAVLLTPAVFNAYRQYPNGSAAKGPWKSPADILDIPLLSAKTLFWNSGVDDDGNGAFKDYAKKCWLYTYISNWATIRSDCVAVYGTVRLTDTSTTPAQTQGLRHFVAVMDRVPATAYQPILTSGSSVKPNPKYQPPRRLLLTWLD